MRTPLPIVPVHNISAADLDRVHALHRDLYSREYGFDDDFAAHVRDTVNEFLASPPSADSCLWTVEQDGELVATIAMIGRTSEEAQLRWFLVDPRYRGAGLGTALLDGALQFARQHGYRRVFLWTVSELTAASALYTRAGFVRTAAETKWLWGARRTEERYDLVLP